MGFFIGGMGGGSSIHKGTTAPSDTEIYWLDTSQSHNILKHYNGSKWVDIGAKSDVDDTITGTTKTWSSSKIANMDIVGKLIEDGINVSPVMTSDTTPSPYVTSASSTYSNYYPWKASNNDGASTYWFTTNVDANGVAWWQIQLDKGYAVNKLKLTSGGSSSSGSDVFYYLKDFVLKGSNDGVTFTNLHAGTQANNADPQTYVFSNSTTYQYYRIESSNAYSSFDYRSIGDVQLYVVSEQNSNKITIKKGVESLLPLLDEAEMYLATDTNKLFIGTSTKNIPISDPKTLAPKLSSSVVSDNLNNAETTSTYSSFYSDVIFNKFTTINKIEAYLKAGVTYTLKVKGTKVADVTPSVDGLIEIPLSKPYVLDTPSTIRFEFVLSASSTVLYNNASFDDGVVKIPEIYFGGTVSTGSTPIKLTLDTYEWTNSNGTSFTSL